MTKEMDFFIYLIEHYAQYKNTTADKILSRWNEFGITDKIRDMYEIYHVERLQNAFDDIDSMMN